jgi:hypothetical protein
VPEIIDPVFAKTSPKRSFCMTENERFGLVFVKTGSINSGTGWPVLEQEGDWKLFYHTTVAISIEDPFVLFISVILNRGGTP